MRTSDSPLTNAELAALEEYSAGSVGWELIEKIPLGKFAEEPPAVLVLFGGTYLAKTVLDGEVVWAVVSKRKGRFFYGSCADSLEALLAWL